MKKDRNCGGYPVYPQMIPSFGGPTFPGQMMPMPAGSAMNYSNYDPMNIPGGSINTTQNNYSTSDLINLTNQVNSLEKRVSRLENLVNNGNYSNNYNSSNYQMM